MRYLFLSFLTFFCHLLAAQHTFSIVALDTLTGEIGSAGASCLDNNQFPGSGGAYIISDILPGRGAIHTQSFYLEQNQKNARQKMQEGLSPKDIIDWLKANDAQNDPSRRQYGIVAFDPVTQKPASSAYTGVNCFNYKNHSTGIIYSIQGNILFNQSILDSMESRFLNTQGTLADRLMSSLQGANRVGADTRCTANGTSSLSAFLRVAKPSDPVNQIYLDLNVPSLPAKTEPIDSLQKLYNLWKLTSDQTATTPYYNVQLFPNPATGEVYLQLEGATDGQVRFFNLSGMLVFEQKIGGGTSRLRPTLPMGTYIIQVFADSKITLTRRLIWQ